MHEQLTKGDRLALRRRRRRPGRGAGRRGQPLVTPRPVVRVGVQPERGHRPQEPWSSDLDAAFKAIRPALTPPSTSPTCPSGSPRPKPDAFVEVVTLREEAYRQIKPPDLRPARHQVPLRPARPGADPRVRPGAARHGRPGAGRRHGTPTPTRYAAGDLVGHGGLQGRYDERLRGAPGRHRGHRAPQAAGGKLEPTGTELFRSEPQPGQPLKTTLDVAAQNAADAALRGRAAPVRPGGGPDQRRRGARRRQRPRRGRREPRLHRPGAAGLHVQDGQRARPAGPGRGHRWTARWTARRPFTVDGRSFKNSDNFELGTVPFRTDFAKSCNTAFASLAPKLGPDGLAAAGRTLGLEASVGSRRRRLHRQGLRPAARRPSRPPPRSARAPPWSARWPWPAPPPPSPAAGGEQPKLRARPGAGQAGRRPAPRSSRSRSAALRTMMREVVTAGTGSALADVPGEPVYGKTGTAEYDNNPAHTHAWFVGWQGDVAFAVFVEQGGASTDGRGPDRRALPPRPGHVLTAARHERSGRRPARAPPSGDPLGSRTLAVSEPPDAPDREPSRSRPEAAPGQAVSASVAERLARRGGAQQAGPADAGGPTGSRSTSP